MKMFTPLIIFWACISIIPSQAQSNFIFEDFNDHDEFNNFSGNSGTWYNENESLCEMKIVNTQVAVNEGACLQVKYSFPGGIGGCGFWHSSIGRNEDTFITLNFLDLYGDLKNSNGNPTVVEDISVTAFSFKAKGNGNGIFDHLVRVEIKDLLNEKASKTFTIPNQCSLAI